MPDTLPVHFVDGSDVELAVNLNKMLVEVTAYDEKTSQRYRLTFARCTLIQLTYSKFDQEGNEADLNDLTEGLQELESLEPRVRRFELALCLSLYLRSIAEISQ